MKKVLIIAYYFPPAGGAGTQRTSKLCKFIPQFGWIPVVLTRCCNIENRGPEDPEDISLLKELEQKEIEIHRIETESKNFGTVRKDNFILAWSMSALNKAKFIIENCRLDLIYVSMPPYELSYIGYELKKHSSIPIVYDLREPWALGGWFTCSNWFQWKKKYMEMKNVLRDSDAVITQTPEARKALLLNFPFLEGDQVAMITNGFDMNDFKNLEECRITNDKNKIYLVHTGFFQTESIYKYTGIFGRIKKAIHYSPEPVIRSGRTPYHLFKAIQVLKAKNHPLILRLKLIFVGLKDPATERCAKECGVYDLITFTGYLPHKESVGWLKAADALFLPNHGLPQGKRSMLIPGKLFEYLASCKPILACLPEGDTRDIIIQLNRGVIADPCDHQSIANALEKFYSIYLENGLRNFSMTPQILNYERRKLCKDFADFFNFVVDKVKFPPPELVA